MTKFCNMCGKKFDWMDEQENFGFDYYIGYGSKFDGENLSANFCCNCFDKIIETLEQKCLFPFRSHKLETAIEKRIPKKVTTQGCPSCGRGHIIEPENHNIVTYCPYCGQAIDWRENNEDTI